MIRLQYIGTTEGLYTVGVTDSNNSGPVLLSRANGSGRWSLLLALCAVANCIQKTVHGLSVALGDPFITLVSETPSLPLAVPNHATALPLPLPLGLGLGCCGCACVRL